MKKVTRTLIIKRKKRKCVTSVALLLSFFVEDEEGEGAFEAEVGE